jgi:hypothetical protein
MADYLDRVLLALRPAFARKAAFCWFVVAVAGIIARADTFGVSSIVRALCLAPAAYPTIIHFFHSSAWQAETLLRHWRQWIRQAHLESVVADRIVLVGDHTNAPKDARRMPSLSTIHQDSETASKPSYFRGHQWACIGLLVGAADRFFALPLWAEIHRDNFEDSRTTRIIKVAAQIANEFGRHAYLVLDAYFSVGPVFVFAATTKGMLHILTRAKKNIVAYQPAPAPDTPRRGRPRLYGHKLHLMKLFDTWADKFSTGGAHLYRRAETVRYLTLDLFWKPVGGMLRFLLVESSRGRIILISSDLTLDALTAITLYSRRVTIETLFDMLKNIVGGMCYHFWSKYLAPSSRRPKKNGATPLSSKPQKTEMTLAAIEKFLAVNIIVLGLLQLVALHYSDQIFSSAQCWLRRPCGKIASVFVTRWTLSAIIRSDFGDIKLGLISLYIRMSQLRLHQTNISQSDGG